MIKRILSIILISLLALGLVVACGGDDGGSSGNGGGQSSSKSKGDLGYDVVISYVLWDSEIASTNVVKAVLQERMGCNVTLEAVDPGVMYASIENGDADGMVAAWLPDVHKDYYEPIKDKIVDLGANLEGAIVGLVVPKYVTIDSIANMNEHAEKFDYEITGINPGSGVMKQTEQAIDEYGLSDIKLVSGSDATMAATLDERYENKEWVCVTGWAPHWMFGKYDLKVLDDPKLIYGPAGEIRTLVKKDLKAEMPEVYEFLDNFYWTPDDMASLMVMNQEEGADPYENAKRWIEENSDKVDKWLQ